MSNLPRTGTVKTDELPVELLELGTAIAALPGAHRDRVQTLYDQVVENNKRRRRILNLVQEALSQLRLDMKYLMFDLDSTRRERDEYRRQVDEWGRE